MKDFNDFCKILASNDDAVKRQTEAVKNLSPEQVQDVYRLILQILREYHEWQQQ